jgi:hypothetical protein
LNVTPHDEARFKTLIADFVRDCGIEPPFHLVVIGANGAVSVALHTDCTTEQVCGCNIAAGFAAPLTVTVIGHDGTGKSAKITVEAAPVTMQ